MSEPDSEEDLEAIAEEIEQGRDSYVIPQELVDDSRESEQQKPGTEPDKEPAISQNLRAEISAMKVGQRLKLALKGNRDARSILIRDSNRLVQRFVLQNPRITEDEIMALCRNRSTERELIEAICKKKEWTANYQIRVALVTNPKTPLMISLRYAPTLLQRDLRVLAKSKNVPSAIGSVARRLLIERLAGKG
jgi:hypothetical protein